MTKYSSKLFTLSIFALWLGGAFTPTLIAETHTAKINDPDGYINVRSRPDSKAPVIGKFKKDEVFYVQTTQSLNDQDENWPAASDGQNLFGFVHKAHIKTIAQVKGMVLIALNSHEQWMADGKLSPIGIFVRTKSFDSKTHKIKRSKEGGVIRIDGMIPYGIDGGAPKVEISAFNIFFGRKRVGLDKEHYADCYEPHLVVGDYGIDARASQSGDKIRINMVGSDGAGGYSVSWIVDRDGKVARIVM